MFQVMAVPMESFLLTLSYDQPFSCCSKSGKMGGVLLSLEGAALGILTARLRSSFFESAEEVEGHGRGHGTSAL